MVYRSKRMQWPRKTLNDRNSNPKAPKECTILSQIRSVIVLGIVIWFSIRIFGADESFTFVQHIASEIGSKPPSKEPLPPPSSLPQTAVIISSSWSPKHPSTEKIEAVINSIRENIIGLNNDATPIFVTVDEIPAEERQAFETKTQDLDEYIKRLHQKYSLPESNIHIVASTEGVGGNIWNALQLLKEKHPSPEYLYNVQHDFIFSRPIDHAALLETMKGHNRKATTSGDKINYILFPYMDWINSCQQGEDKIAIIPSTTTAATTDASASTTTVLCKSCRYSDSSHLVEFDWYYHQIGSLGYRKRTPESAIEIHARNEEQCKNYGLHLYIDEKGFTTSKQE